METSYQESIEKRLFVDANISPKVLIALFGIAAQKDDNRPNLKCVHIAEAKAEAADGVIYASINLSNMPAGTDILVPPTLLPFLKRCKRDEQVTIRDAGAEVSCISYSQGTMAVPRIYEPRFTDKDGKPVRKFPDAASIMPKGDPVPTTEIGLDGILLVRFSKCLQEWQGCNDAPPLHLYLFGPSHPVMIRCQWDRDGFVGLQMPMHIRCMD